MNPKPSPHFISEEKGVIGKRVQLIKWEEKRAKGSSVGDSAPYHVGPGCPGGQSRARKGLVMDPGPGTLGSGGSEEGSFNKCQRSKLSTPAGTRGLATGFLVLTKPS